MTTTTVDLRSGGRLPLIGLGTWPMTGGECTDAVLQALDLGYRLLDTAENYRNEDAVGAAVAQTGVPRDDIFVTTKFNKEWHGRDLVRPAAEAALERLGLDHVDLLLIHWPNPDQNRYVEAFEGLLEVQQAGLARAIGTSNFNPTHLAELARHGYVPEVNQIQLDPTRPRVDWVAAHAAAGIVTQAWSPLSRDNREELLALEPIRAAAAAHDRTPAQIVLRWDVQHGYSTVPKSGDPQRQAENLDLFSFELTSDEMAAIDQLADPDADFLDPEVFGH